jgi:thiol-disulfide isomerase/thioredoxin
MTLGKLLVSAACLSLAAAANAQRDSLAVGDAAPGLDIEKWVKGEAVTLESGKPYVVEFWATWCVPCRKAIPHLTELQRKYQDKNLTIIGISSEEVGTVEPFVRSQAEKMDYTVAVDRDSSTSRAWMAAAGLKGIPAAFIVDQQSRIAYIGNPHDEQFDVVLRRVMSGRYNPRLEKETAPILSAARQARKVRNWRMALQHYDQAMQVDPRTFAGVGLEKFEMLLIDMNKRQDAYDYARKLMATTYAADAEALRMLAEKIATAPKLSPEQRDMDVALEAATMARQVSGSGDPEALATLALIRFHRGEVDQAIDLQKEAFFLAKPGVKPGYRQVLTAYQEAAVRQSVQRGG